MATACGGSDRPAPPLAPSPAPPPPPLDLNGAYVGSGDDFLGIGRMRWVLSHTGTAVEGTVTATDTQGGISARGTLAGRLDGSTLFFTIAMPRGGLTAVPSCSATIEGIGDVTVSTISGLFSGTATCSASFFGQFVLTKE